MSLPSDTDSIEEFNPNQPLDSEPNSAYSQNRLSFQFFESKLNELSSLTSRSRFRGNKFNSKNKMPDSIDSSSSSISGHNSNNTGVRFPIFSGTKASSQEARSFLTKFIAACKLRGYTTDVKVCLQFGLCLESGSSAESWYQSELAKLDLDDCNKILSVSI